MKKFALFVIFSQLCDWLSVNKVKFKPSNYTIMKRLTLSMALLLAVIMTAVSASAQNALTPEVQEVVNLFDNSSREILKAKSNDQMGEIAQRYDSQLMPYKQSKTAITSADRQALIDAVYNMLYATVNASVTMAGMDPDDPTIISMLAPTINTIKEQVANATDSASTLGEFLVLTENFDME